jgi:hypothetical protein
MEISLYFISKEKFQYTPVYSRFGGEENKPAPAGNQTQLIQYFANNLSECIIPTHIHMYIETYKIFTN